MAEPMNEVGAFFANNWATITGWMGAIVGPYLVYRATSRKSDVDESALVLGKWKELVDAHEAAIKRLTEDFDRERKHWRSENDRLQKRIDQLEEQGAAKDHKIDLLENEVSGLRRSIIQNSQSTATLIGSPEKYTHNRKGGE